jgi:hypothetical protein
VSNLTDPLSPERIAEVRSLIGPDIKPAQPGLVVSFAEAVRDRREHDHTSQREDWYCLNLSAYIGERIAPVLRRLVDAEAEVDRLRDLAKQQSASLTTMLRHLEEQQIRLDAYEAAQRADESRAAVAWKRVTELERRDQAADNLGAFISCSGAGCQRGEWEGTAAGRGWEPGSGVTEWLCPQCAANAADRREYLERLAAEDGDR